MTEKKKRRRHEVRAEKYAASWAAAIHVELLVHWGRSGEGPMPTREDAERLARERTTLLREGLGEWAEVEPKMLDLNERTTTRRRRRWERNAWPRSERHDRDDGPWWDYLWGE